MLPELVIGMAGSGGDGVVSAGEALIAAAARRGYHAMLTKSFGSQIRGGESSFRLRLGVRPVLNPGGDLTVAVALNWEDFRRFGSEMPIGPDTFLIHDAKAGPSPYPAPGEPAAPAAVRSVAIGGIAEAAAGTERAKNSVVLGLMAGWFCLEPDELAEGLRRKFAAKGEAILAGNQRAFAAGLEHARSHPIGEVWRLEPARPAAGRREIRDGNQVCAAAALAAGCRFFGGYPITPATEIMQQLEKDIGKRGGAILQAEDEIAGIGAAIGASFAGRKAMTATSGPGLSLKTEMLGLASIAELPLVCVDVQRGGPSTGLPTKREQSDLFAAAFSAHGDSVRPILAPTGVGDMFAVTVEAFNLAEEFQTPVIVLSDQEIAQRKEVVEAAVPANLRIVERLRPAPEELSPYVRFRLTESGVSPISHPGMAGGGYLAAGIEHDELGAPTVNGAMHARMNEKRLRKLEPLQRRRDLFEFEGDPEAEVGVIGWGSLAGVAREAVRAARAEGRSVRLLVPKLLYPVAEPVYSEFFRPLRRCLVVEQSQQGQLYRILRMWARVPEEFHLLARSGANPIAPGEVLDQLRILAEQSPAFASARR
jgi:2-oxoglutarate/2-oxoacid ferredoxin oxidoreductase subunit alpha